MATTIDYWPGFYAGLGKFDLFTFSGGKWVFSTSPSVNHPPRRTRTYTDTIRRVPPADKFLGATSRTYVTEIYSKTLYDWTTSDPPYFSGVSLYQQYPLWNMYPVSSTRVNGSGTPISDPVTNVSRAAMYNTIRKQLKNDATNLANMLGEYRETAETFRQLAEAVVSRGRSLIRRRKGGRRGQSNVSVTQTVAGNHLAYQYGIRPLAQDMGTAIAELRSALVTNPPFKQGVVKRHDKVSNFGYRQPNSTIYTRWAESTLIIETHFRSQWRAYMNTNSLLSCLADHGMLNPASLAWELMPYSFAIDWFFNVGDVLSSLDNFAICDRLLVLDSSSVRRFEYLQPGVRANNLSRPVGFYTKRTDTRSVPVEISRLATIAYKPEMSVGHILNGLALLFVTKERLS